MPLTTLLSIIGGVILLAALTVALVLGLMPAHVAGWVIPGAVLLALVARYTLSRL